MTEDESFAERKRRRLAELEAMEEPVTAAFATELIRLAEALKELDLIATENPGRPKYAAGQIAIEVDHPEPRLYGFAGDGSDTICCTRARGGGYEHSALDEHGMPIEWRAVPRRPSAARPDLN